VTHDGFIEMINVLRSLIKEVISEDLPILKLKGPLIEIDMGRLLIQRRAPQRSVTMDATCSTCRCRQGSKIFRQSTLSQLRNQGAKDQMNTSQTRLLRSLIRESIEAAAASPEIINLTAPAVEHTGRLRPTLDEPSLHVDYDELAATLEQARGQLQGFIKGIQAATETRRSPTILLTGKILMPWVGRSGVWRCKLSAEGPFYFDTAADLVSLLRAESVATPVPDSFGKGCVWDMDVQVILRPARPDEERLPLPPVSFDEIGLDLDPGDVFKSITSHIISLLEQGLGHAVEGAVAAGTLKQRES